MGARARPALVQRRDVPRLARTDAEELPPAASLVPAPSASGVCRRASNLPGLRLGWLCCRDRAFLAAVEQQKD